MSRGRADEVLSVVGLEDAGQRVVPQGPAVVGIDGADAVDGTSDATSSIAVPTSVFRMLLY